MTQTELENEIAQRTGEDIVLIRRRGFSVLNLSDTQFDPPPIHRPQYVDWDEVERWR